LSLLLVTFSFQFFQIGEILNNLPEVKGLRENTVLNKFVIVGRVAMIDDSGDFRSWDSDIVRKLEMLKV